jgi:hypothetical protein
MLARLILMIALGLSLEGCAHFHKKPEPAAAKKPDMFSAHEPDQDVAFQAFLTNLRKAIAKKDIPMVASMMTSDFAYYQGKTPAEDRTGDGVFQFWDENGLWPELQLVIKGQFISMDRYMVTPPQLALEENFHGYRAGITQVNGTWKFAYFVTDPPQ